MAIRRFKTKGEKETKKIAINLAGEILKKKERKAAVILALEGDLGGGKTTFLQGFAKGLGIKEKILSPTFLIMKRFEITGGGNKNGFKNFFHFDCYRTTSQKDIIDLGWEKIISFPENIIAVEWAEMIKKIIPKSAIKIKFDFIGKNKRKIFIRQ